MIIQRYPGDEEKEGSATLPQQLGNLEDMLKKQKTHEHSIVRPARLALTDGTVGDMDAATSSLLGHLLFDSEVPEPARKRQRVPLSEDPGVPMYTCVREF